MARVYMTNFRTIPRHQPKTIESSEKCTSKRQENGCSSEQHFRSEIQPNNGKVAKY